MNLTTHPWETRECLVCHAPGAIDATDRSSFTAMLSEGVGCESCHGAARDWLVPHRDVPWKFSDHGNGSWKANLGFVETKAIGFRADRCADCHVGNGNQSVNHDLIAAGHPRLAFEFAAYQSQMPIHWRHGLERQRSPVANAIPSSSQSTYDARNWLIGQIVNADHELEMLAAVAKDSGKTWPELAQYDCFACHHELSSPGWRQSRTARDLRPGELPWGTWNLGLLEEADLVTLGPRFSEEQRLLRAQMKTLAPDRGEVLSLVISMRHELSLARTAFEQQVSSSDTLIAIRTKLLHRSDTMINQGWDRSTQLYLAAVALDKGSSDARGLGNQVILGEPSRYARLKKLLSFRSADGHIPEFHHLESPRNLESNWSSLKTEFEYLKSTATTNSAQDMIPPPPATRLLETE